MKLRSIFPLVLLLLLPTLLIAQRVDESIVWPDLVEGNVFGYPFNGRLPFFTPNLKGRVPPARKLWQAMQLENNNSLEARVHLQLSSDDAPLPSIGKSPTIESSQKAKISPQSDLTNVAENEWAGIYVLQNTEIMSTVFRWSPSVGYVGLGTESCGGIVSDISYGSVFFSKDSLRLFPVPKLPLNGKQEYRPIYLPTNLVPVKWGGAHYLVFTAQLKAFCDDYVAGLGNYSSINVQPFIKLEDENVNDLSKPLLPSKYSRLAKQPLIAKVKSIGQTHLVKKSREGNAHLDTEIILNVGRTAKVRAGMSFIIFDLEEDPRIFSRDMEITAVTETSSIGIFSRYLEQGDPQNLAKLRQLKKSYFQTVKTGMRVCRRTQRDVGTNYPQFKN